MLNIAHNQTLALAHKKMSREKEARQRRRREVDFEDDVSEQRNSRRARKKVAEIDDLLDELQGLL